MTLRERVKFWTRPFKVDSRQRYRGDYTNEHFRVNRAKTIGTKIHQQKLIILSFLCLPFDNRPFKCLESSPRATTGRRYRDTKNGSVPFKADRFCQTTMVWLILILAVSETAPGRWDTGGVWSRRQNISLWNSVTPKSFSILIVVPEVTVQHYNIDTLDR